MGGWNNPFPPVYFGTNQNGPFKDAYRQRPVLPSRAKRPPEAIQKEQIQVHGVEASLTSVMIRVFDAKTGEDITEGAKVYVDGMLVTNYQAGTFISQAPTGMTTIIQAAKDGYFGAKTDLILSSSQLVEIALSPDSSADRKYTVGIQVYPAIPNVEVSDGVTTALTDSSGLAVLTNVPAGLTTITASFSGYSTASINPDVSRDETFNLVLIKSVDAGTTEDAPPSTRESLPSALDFSVIRNVSEDVSSNGDYENYFTSSQCRVYIGNLFLDELYSIQYVLQSNKVPVFGYSSQFMDAVAQGRSLVQGQIAINYVMDRYLYVALDNYRKLFLEGKNEVEVGSGEDLMTLERLQQLSASNTRNREVASKLDVVTIRKLKQMDRVRLAKETSVNPYQNPVYLPVPFDIMIEIGSGASRTVRRIEKAVLISNEQVIDQSGQGLLDVYGFIARRLR